MHSTTKPAPMRRARESDSLAATRAQRAAEGAARRQARRALRRMAQAEREALAAAVKA
jgi:Spy/CpxP family protein refolding chaperone